MTDSPALKHSYPYYKPSYVDYIAASRLFLKLLKMSNLKVVKKIKLKTRAIIFKLISYEKLTFSLLADIAILQGQILDLILVHTFYTMQYTHYHLEMQ